ncbi:hypothetical protein QYS46_25055 [Klebsiella michiganensis]|nr:hypothetical protein [Klebsiella michiganensis]
MPEACVDAAVVASAFVMNLQAIVARETSPLESAVVTIGKMDVGTRFNVIAENAVLDGTVRCFSLEARQRLETYHYPLCRAYRRGIWGDRSG